MSALTRETLWAGLRDAALVEGEAPAPAADRAPWYVRVMLGFAGWIGAFFLLGFVGVGFGFVMKSATASVLVGAAACAAATAIFRMHHHGDFASQFGLAVSLAGQALIAFGLFRWFGRSTGAAALAVAVQQALLFVLVPNFVHRVWTAWSGTYAAAFALFDLGLYAFAPAAVTAAFLTVWLHEFDHPRHGELLRAGGYGLALAAVQTAVMHGGLYYALVLGRGTGAALGGEAGAWIAAAAAGAVLLWAVVTLLRRESVPLASGPGKVALAGATILALATLKAPGVGPAVAILVVGYANGNRVLAGLGIAAVLGYLSHYYYSLQVTLLEKSALLACVGLALLVARFALHRWWPRTQEVDRA
ncbi:MAG TPA: DUF4401 domain-containing protein [Burkholderiales bacterium]|nr:DUF4401 domain-containing protein [Burkholderiales bacterium]